MVMIYVFCLKFSEGHYNSTVGSSFGGNSDFVTLLYQHGYIGRSALPV